MQIHASHEADVVTNPTGPDWGRSEEDKVLGFPSGGSWFCLPGRTALPPLSPLPHRKQTLDHLPSFSASFLLVGGLGSWGGFRA